MASGHPFSYIRAMATYLELQEQVQKRIIDLPAPVLAEVPNLVKYAVRQLQDKHDFKVMEALSGPNVTVPDTRALLAKPANWKKARGDAYYVPFLDNRPTDVRWAADRNAVQDMFTQAETGNPQFLIESEPTDELGNSNFEVWPLTDTSSDWSDFEYRVYIPYWKYLTTLSADGDQNWLTINGDLFIIASAAARGFELDWDEERMAVQKQLAADELQQVIMKDKKARMALTHTLVIHREGANSPALRR